MPIHAQDRPPSLTACLIAGGVAGASVDIILFPLDTLKTRLQSAEGLSGSGGLRGLYSGISSTIVGSAPGAALFFLTYETMKRALSVALPAYSNSPWVHLLSSSIAEIVFTADACTVRVPIEVLKQRMQVLQYRAGLLAAIKGLYKAEGALGFYRGFQATIQREIPFACVQFPLYEYLKRKWHESAGAAEVGDELVPWKAALCGSFAGGLTAALTTPLDVIKTRTMLSQKEELRQFEDPIRSIRRLLAEGGLRKLFAGAWPRVLWISLGGYIFFGSYEKMKRTLQTLSPKHPI